MNIKIEKKNFEKLNIEPLKAKSGQVLDYLWGTGWMRFAISKTDRSILDELQGVADKLSLQSDIVLVLADGRLGELIQAAVSAAAPKEEKAEVIVFGNSLSPADYAELLGKLEEKRFSILAVSNEEESPQLRGAYVTLKQLMISKFGKEQAAERLYAAAGPKSKFFSEEAAGEDFPLISLPDFAPEISGNTAAVLLPLAIRGVDPVEYLNGFYEMLASPAWDDDAVDYAIGCAACDAEETMVVWQRQLKDFADFQSSAVMLPAGAEAVPEEGFETLLLAEKDDKDIMMPFFEGCHEDGSLNLLLVDTAEKHFANEKPGVKISVEYMNDYNLGQLFAFFQLSKGITTFLSAEK